MRFQNDPISIYQSLSRGLVGAWCPSLGASGYRLLDRSGYGNHGVLTGMDPGTDWVPSGGKLALDFDGSNDYFSITNPVQGVPFTISFWGFGNTSGILFSMLSANVNAWDGWYGVIGELAAVNNNSFGSSLQNPLASSLVWQHHCFSITDNSTGVYYVNGVAGTGAINRTPSQGNYRFTIGCSYRKDANSNGQDNFANGKIDDFRIYNRALTPNEIRLLYTGGRGVGLMPEIKPIRNRSRAIATTPTRNRSSRYLTFPG